MNLGTALFGIVLVVGGVAASNAGWISLPAVLDLGMILVGLTGLAGVLKLPWDIYFEARGLVVDQEESERRGIEVDSEEKTYARAAARRLLLLCLLSHALAAALSAGASWASGGRIGYAFAGFFLVSTLFRPMGSFYQHMKARLLELRRRARVPREDAVQLLSKVRDLEGDLRMARSELGTLRQELVEKEHDATRERGRLVRHVEELDARQTSQQQRYEAKVDRVCREFQDSVSRLTAEKEILEGMRAFVRLVKEA